MRYIIIPLVVGLYVWWSTKSIYDIIVSMRFVKNNKFISFIDIIYEWTIVWITINVIAILAGIVFLSIKYW